MPAGCEVFTSWGQTEVVGGVRFRRALRTGRVKTVPSCSVLPMCSSAIMDALFLFIFMEFHSIPDEGIRLDSFFHILDFLQDCFMMGEGL